MRAGLALRPSRLIAVLAMLGACRSLAPKYHAPAVAVPTHFKEWHVARPSDAVIHGKWWEVFNDPQLNALEEKVNVSNQNIAASFAAFMQARALIKQARAQYFPTLSVAPSATAARQVPVPGVPRTTYQLYQIPLEASWAPDLWGRVRSTVDQNIAAAQVSAADLENERLTEQATLATDYYELRGQDALKQLYDSTIIAYRQALELTKSLYETGIDSEQSVVQAQTQLATIEAQDTNLDIARAQYEHAIALLVGEPASTFSIPVEPWKAVPPAIPFGVPSQLLERRPDIAAAERNMAEANAQIGIAKAAYFPTITLSASGGLESTSLATLFSLPALVWSLGASASETIFDAGLRSATVEQYRAVFDQAVANYRQTVLAAFQQVEDALAELRILDRELQQQEAAVAASQKNVAIALDLFRTGIDPYLDVITAETTLLTNQQTEVTLRMEQLTTSVALIEALGGGWSASQLPSERDILSSPPKIRPPG